MTPKKDVFPLLSNKISGTKTGNEGAPGSVLLEDVPCPMGCPRDDVCMLAGHDQIHDLPGKFTVVKCNTCGLLRTNPRPTADTINFYYPDDYGPYLGTQIRDKLPNSSIKELLRPLVKRIFNTKAQELPSMVPGTMLEVGCASGAFLHEMAEQGWRVEGIEFSETAALSARQLGYKVHSCSLENAPAPEYQLDLIVGWMVFEHLHDPIGCLEKLYEWASPGARLVLSVPNANSLEFQIFKDKWYALHLPNHLFHFTPYSFAQLLKAGGWTLEKVHHQRLLNNLIMSMAYAVESKGWSKLGRLLRNITSRKNLFYALFPLAWLLSAFGQTGRMTVWAKK